MMSDPIETHIDLVVVLKTLWRGKWRILLFLTVFAAWGVILAALTPKEYQSKTIWVNQSEQTFGGNRSVAGLAAMVGFDMRSMEGSNELTPADYGDFIETLEFQYALMHTPLRWEQFGDSMSLVEYYREHYRPGVVKGVANWVMGLPGRIVGGEKGKRVKGEKVNSPLVPESPSPLVPQSLSPFSLSDTEVWIRFILLDKMELTLNEGMNMVTLEVEMRDPLAAAELAGVAQRLLKDKITELKVDKARSNLAFTQRLFEEKKLLFIEAQDRLAKFRDRNLNLGSERARKEEEILYSEYQVAFSVYSQMATQLESAKIRVEEDTPLFSVVEEATIPNGPSKPKKMRYLLIWAFLGGFTGLIVVLSRPIVKKVKNRWNDIDTE